MSSISENILAVMLLLNLGLTASSRLSACISMVTMQGWALGLVPLFFGEGLTVRSILLAGFVILLKGMVFPYLLADTVRRAGVRRELEPFVGYSFSLIIGIVLTAVAFWLRAKLPLSSEKSIVLPAAIATIFIGLFLLVSRRKAVMQALGYLVLENGITVFGLATVAKIPLLVELGMLLDAFVAVFVMAIIICHISREFDHIDVDRLRALKG